MKKTKKIVLTYISLLVLLFSTLPTIKSAEAQESSEKTYSALFLVSYGYGDNYYDIVDIFTDWNWTVETAGKSTFVTGCHNFHEARSLVCNLTFDDLDETIIKEYDCVIIPSGGHWGSLVSSSSVETILITAHKNGLILGTLCIGQAVLANTDGLMNGVKVAYFSMTYDSMQTANAEIIYKDVVLDRRIVTGGGGGSLAGGGHTVAPTYEFCETVKTTIETRDKNRIIYPIIGSIGGIFVVSGGFLLFKKREKIFSKLHKKVQQNKE